MLATSDFVLSVSECQSKKTIQKDEHESSILIIVDIALEIFMHKQCECEYERGKHINSYLSMK